MVVVVVGRVSLVFGLAIRLTRERKTVGRELEDHIPILTQKEREFARLLKQVQKNA
jgi:uncharacterized protein YneF (UPF0154 family)